MSKIVLVAIGLVGVIALFAALYHENPEDKALEARAIQEVETRMSPTPAFDAISVEASRAYYTNACLGSRDWDKKVGVTEMIDVTSPSPSRVSLWLCVNTETWQIRFDDDLSAASLVDDTKYLAAQRYCFRLTDAANEVRYAALSRRYSSVFLSVRPDDEETTNDSFSCTSSFDLRPAMPYPAVWRLFPNRQPASDRPITPTAVDVQRAIGQP